MKVASPRAAVALPTASCTAAAVREPSLPPGLIPNDLPQAPRSLWLQATYQL